MDAYTKASRAVLAAYAKKTLLPFEIAAIVLFILAMLGTAWLIVQISAWWWVLMILVIAYGLIGSIVWLIIHFTIDKLRPEQDSEQKAAVKRFISDVDKIADTMGTTRFGLLLRIIRDVMQHRDRNILTEFADDSSALTEDFKQVVKLFQ